MDFFIDFLIVSSIIIFLTAFLGVIPNHLSEKILGRNNKNKFKHRTNQMTAGWKEVGGNGKKRKNYY